MNWIRAYIAVDKAMMDWAKEASADYPDEHFDIAMNKIIDCFIGICIIKEYGSGFWGGERGGMQITDGCFERNFAQVEWQRAS